MSNTAGRFRKTPTPKVELGQFWKDKSGIARRVVEPLDQWEVHFARVTDGRRSRVQRVSSWGAPSGGYTLMPKVEEESDPVHIRLLGGGEQAATYCGRPAAGLITTTLEHLGWWKRRGNNICPTCQKRATDGVHAVLDEMQAVVQGAA